MESFIRLNLNAIICGIPMIIISIVSLILVLKIKNKELRTFGIYVWNIVAAVFAIVLVGVILTQVSVNQLEKSEVDREYTEQSKESYQQRVLKNSEEKK